MWNKRLDAHQNFLSRNRLYKHVCHSSPTYHERSRELLILLKSATLLTSSTHICKTPSSIQPSSSAQDLLQATLNSSFSLQTWTTLITKWSNEPWRDLKWFINRRRINSHSDHEETKIEHSMQLFLHDFAVEWRTTLRTYERRKWLGAMLSQLINGFSVLQPHRLTWRTGGTNVGPGFSTKSFPPKR